MNNSSKRNKNQKIRIICAWCGKDMGEKEGEGIEGVSHGMCDQCAKNMQAKSGKGINEKDS